MNEQMDVLTKIEEAPLGFAELKRMLGPALKRTKLIGYDELKGVQSLSGLFGDKKSVIILLEIEAPDAPKVGHWIALLDMGDHYEHFDSYGIDVDEELALTHEEPWLSQLLDAADKPIRDSGTRYQQVREHINTCGRWCVARVRLQKLTLDHFKDVIDQAHATPDITVALMTMFL
jgi:hypothetical protein